MAKIDAFFQLMIIRKYLDLHLVAGQQPAIRIRGEIERIKYDVLTNEALKVLLYEITPEHKIKQFEETGDVDSVTNFRGWHATGLITFSKNTELARFFVRSPIKLQPVQSWDFLQ